MPNVTVRGDLSTPENFLATVQAESACWKTYLEYFDILDRRQPAQLAADCFTEAAHIAYDMKGAPLTFNTRSEYASFLVEATAAHEMTAHVVGQHLFVWTEGKPRLYSYVTSWQWFAANSAAGSNRPADFVTIGRAQDDFELVSGKWLISNRVVAPVAGLTAIGVAPSFGQAQS
jgi:hypothetical protein